MTSLQIHGHRGCRGLMPENTLLAFQRALEMGVDTLEMDVCISRDKQVVVSHEPWFSPVYCTAPDGSTLDTTIEKHNNFYQLYYADIVQFDCGLKYYDRFPAQQKIAAYKPLLSEVIALAEAYSSHTIRYNIEIKYTVEGDGIFHPGVQVFSDLLMDLLLREKINERCMVQCFDTSVLTYLHQAYPAQTLSYLVEEPGSVREHLQRLDFIPQVYSPDFTFLTPAEMEFCRLSDMQVIPWTVNELKDMEQLIQLGVDGIITDYPDRLISLTND